MHETLARGKTDTLMGKTETYSGHSTRDRYGDKITTDAARLGDTTEPYLLGGHSNRLQTPSWGGRSEWTPKILLVNGKN